MHTLQLHVTDGRCSFDSVVEFAPCFMQVLLLEHDINTSPFTPAVHACVPPLPWSVTQADVDDRNRCALPGQLQEQSHVPASLSDGIAQQHSHHLPGYPASLPPNDWCMRLDCREDLRHLCVCSVDPPGCKDIDDALHVRS